MFTHILIPLDGTPDATVALAPARIVATATNAAVTLFTAIDHDASESDFARATSDLEHVAENFRIPGLAIHARVTRGAPADDILRVADEVGADLIVMATHGRSGLARAFLGSVAQHVVSTSPIPVLLQRPGGHTMTKLGTIVVPVDGSLGGAIALASAIPLARSANAAIVLVDVVVPVVAYMTSGGAMDGYGSLYFDDNWDAEALESASRYVSGMVERLVHAGVKATGRAVSGKVYQPSTSVAEAIMTTADEVDADLIVMSTHALTGPSRAFLGSVADMVVRNAHRPVLLPKRGGPEDSREAHLLAAHPAGADA